MQHTVWQQRETSHVGRAVSAVVRRRWTLAIVLLTDQRGGICRYVLEDHANEATLLKNKIASASLDVLKTFAGQPLLYEAEMPHSLLHFVVDKEFNPTGVVWASAYVSARVTWRQLFSDRAQIRQLIAAAEGEASFAALRGLLFEEVAHTALARGGSFEIENLGAAAPNRRILEVPTDLKSVPLVSLSALGSVPSGTYVRPVAKNFAAVDAIIIPRDLKEPLLLCQMTVGRTHPIKLARLRKLLAVLPADREKVVVFVLPAATHAAAEFAKQHYTTKGKEAVNLPATVKNLLQCKLLIPLDAEKFQGVAVPEL